LCAKSYAALYFFFFSHRRRFIWNAGQKPGDDVDHPRARPRPAVEREKERVVDAMPAFETSNAAAADAQSFGIRSDWRDDDGNNASSSSLLAKPIKTVKDKFELLPAFLKVRGLGTTTLVSRARSVSFKRVRKAQHGMMSV